MTRRPLPLLLLALAALALAGCAGATDADPAGLPVADDESSEEPATSALCVEDEPDCEDTLVPGDEQDTDGAAAGSCLAGDADCTDESYGGGDVARPVPLSDAPSGAERATRAASSGATGHRIEHAHLLDDSTLELTVGDTPCMVVEDVLVTESPDEVRVLVLAGQDAGVDACIQSYVQWSLEVALDAPLGDRTLLDLAG